MELEIAIPSEYPAVTRDEACASLQIGCYNSLVRTAHYRLMLKTIHRLLENRKLLLLVII